LIDDDIQTHTLIYAESAGFKLILKVTYKTIQTGNPPYLTDFLVPYVISHTSIRFTRSSSSHLRRNLLFFSRAFCVSAPEV